MANIALPGPSSTPEPGDESGPGATHAGAAITGLVLAGGAGRRMGGVDKGLQCLGDMSLVQHVCRRLAPQVSTLLISANRHQKQYASLGYHVLGDAPEHLAHGYCGPLAGLYSGLTQADSQWVLCVPCDTPFLPADLALRLLAGVGSAPGSLARCDGLRQPALCLLRRDLAGSIRDFLASGERKLGLWQQQQGFVAVDFPDPQAFANVNCTDDLRRFDDRRATLVSSAH